MNLSSIEATDSYARSKSPSEAEMETAHDVVSKRGPSRGRIIGSPYIVWDWDSVWTLHRDAFGGPGPKVILPWAPLDLPHGDQRVRTASHSQFRPNGQAVQRPDFNKPCQIDCDFVNDFSLILGDVISRT
jgi:hypothetical protein